MAWKQALAGFLAFGCGAAEPRLAAEGSGDLSNPPAARENAVAALHAACGDGAPLAAEGALVRAPYVQATESNATRILFSTSATVEESIRLTHTDGSPVALTTAEADAGVSTPLGVRQLDTRLEGLEPDTVYCYALDSVTAPAGFRTAPSADSERPVRFAAFGDSGSGTRFQRAVAEQLLTVPLDFVVHTGDLAYPTGTRAAVQRTFFDVYPTLVRSFPMFPSLGNHDYKTENGAALLEAFSLPEAGRPGKRGNYYSFDWGGVHLVALDTERIDQEQLDWLDADLAANAGSWLVVFGHRPPYSSGEHGSSVSMRRLVVPILERHRVALVLSGHDHDYERSWPINDVTYVVTGGGGAMTRPVWWSWFTAYSEDVLHFVFVEVDRDALVLHAIDGTGREFDSTRIERRADRVD